MRTEKPTLEQFMAKLGERTEPLRLYAYEPMTTVQTKGIMRKYELRIEPADLLNLITDVLEEA